MLVVLCMHVIANHHAASEEFRAHFYKAKGLKKEECVPFTGPSR